MPSPADVHQSYFRVVNCEANRTGYTCEWHRLVTFPRGVRLQELKGVPKGVCFAVMTAVCKIVQKPSAVVTKRGGDQQTWCEQEAAQLCLCLWCASYGLYFHTSHAICCLQQASREQFQDDKVISTDKKGHNAFTQQHSSSETPAHIVLQGCNLWQF